MNGITFAGYRPGVLGGLAGGLAGSFARSHGFGVAFEAKVAREMAVFLDRFQGDRDLFATAWRGEALAGGLVLDAGDPADGDLAHLRWVFVAGAERGQGLGGALLGRALDRARAIGKAGVYLTTVAGLDAAAALYETAGFVVTDRRPGETWGRAVEEIRQELRF